MFLSPDMWPGSCHFSKCCLRYDIKNIVEEETRELSLMSGFGSRLSDSRSRALNHRPKLHDPWGQSRIFAWFQINIGESFQNTGRMSCFDRKWSSCLREAGYEWTYSASTQQVSQGDPRPKTVAELDGFWVLSGSCVNENPRVSSCAVFYRLTSFLFPLNSSSNWNPQQLFNLTLTGLYLMFSL